MAHLALAGAARVVSDFARGLVPTRPGRAGYGGLLTGDAVQLARLVEDVLAAAIVAERADGVGWQDIGDALGVDPDQARDRWAAMVDRWDTDLARAAGPAHDDDQLPEVLTGPPTVRASWTAGPPDTASPTTSSRAHTRSPTPSAAASRMRTRSR